MSKEYNKYLQEHKNNVAKAFYWIQTNLPELLTGDYDYERQICVAHDKSKSDSEEYETYDEYFYGDNQSYEVKQKFNYAWLHHIHKNKHHWQYWILNNDDPNEGEIFLDMPYNYIIEMICDWWSFGFGANDLGSLFSWYNEHKIYMKLSEQTRWTVEYILREINKQI